jgi:hypothetical protein
MPLPTDPSSQPSTPGAAFVRTPNRALLIEEIKKAADQLAGESLVALHATALALCGVPVVLPKRTPTEYEIRAKARGLSHAGKCCVCGFASVNAHGLYRHYRRNHRPQLIERVLKGE